MTTATAKVFQSGNSQAIRLPKAFRLRSKVVRITRTPGGLLISDDEEEARRLRVFRSLAGSCPEFPEIAPTPPDSPREALA